MNIQICKKYCNAKIMRFIKFSVKNEVYAIFGYDMFHNICQFLVKDCEFCNQIEKRKMYGIFYDLQKIDDLLKNLDVTRDCKYFVEQELL